MPNNELETLVEAVDAYRKAYGQEPRHRRVLGHLEQVLYETQRLSPQGGQTPGHLAAIKSTGKPLPPPAPAPPLRPSAARGGQETSQPSSFASAREAAATRLAEGQAA